MRHCEFSSLVHLMSARPSIAPHCLDRVWNKKQPFTQGHLQAPSGSAEGGMDGDSAHQRFRPEAVDERLCPWPCPHPQLPPPWLVSPLPLPRVALSQGIDAGRTKVHNGTGKASRSLSDSPGGRIPESPAGVLGGTALVGCHLQPQVDGGGGRAASVCSGCRTRRCHPL